MFPVVALGVGGHVGLSDDPDQLPLLLRGLGPLPHRLLQLVAPPPLSVLLYQLPLRQPLTVIQHHCRSERGSRGLSDRARGEAGVGRQGEAASNPATKVQKFGPQNHITSSTHMDSAISDEALQLHSFQILFHKEAVVH